MKRNLVILTVMFMHTVLWGMLLYDQPISVRQPDGRELALFASGDEYYSYLHDAEGYTIVQDSQTGYYVYAEQARGELIAGAHRVDEISPSSFGLEPGLRISFTEYQARKNLFSVPQRYNSRAPNTGTLNNLVVYIRFADQTEFPEPRTEFDPLFNAMDGQTPSMRSYYQEVSYNNLEISSTHYPITDMNTNLSYQAEQPRSYYSPYNAVTNPQGYDGWQERAIREQTLLADAIAYIAEEVPESLDIDGDDDGLVDNVCFIIRGGNDGWSDLLWAHRWSLYMVDAYINGYQVIDFTFQPRTQVEVTTLNHEMFHALGAPDLYHYNNNVYSPAASWDIMESGSGHMSAYMKYRYGGWIEEIPLISEPGTYSLNPLTSSENNVYRINSPNSVDEYFVLEYRKWVEDSYEMNLPSEGLLIWRVDNGLSGEGNADGPPDELYLYRPGGTISSNGNTDSATFNAAYYRTEFSDTTNPEAWLQDGGLGGIFIHQVGYAEDQITFTFNPSEGFIAGNLMSNLPEVDYTQGRVQLGDMEINVDESGNYSGMYYSGDYTITASLPGHGNVSEQITITEGMLTEQDFYLQQLLPPENLDYLLTDNQLDLFWDFTNNEDPDFLQFNIWLKLDMIPNFQHIANTEDNFYQATLASGLEYQYYITAEYESGFSMPTDTLSISLNTDNDGEVVNILRPSLSNYPNPFNPQTVISYSLPEISQNTQLQIFNMKGQLVNSFMLKDTQGSFLWKGTNFDNQPVSSGIYFTRIITPDVNLSSKMLLIK